MNLHNASSFRLYYCLYTITLILATVHMYLMSVQPSLSFLMLLSASASPSPALVSFPCFLFRSASLSCEAPTQGPRSDRLKVKGPDLRSSQAEAAVRASPRVLVLNKRHLEHFEHDQPFPNSANYPSKQQASYSVEPLHIGGSAVAYCRHALFTAITGLIPGLARAIECGMVSMVSRILEIARSYIISTAEEVVHALRMGRGAGLVVL